MKMEIQQKEIKIFKGVRSECLHDGCPECHGTGRKQDGTMCVHYLSCPCPKCTPRYF